MAGRTKTLFESVASRGRIAKQGDVVMIVIDGGGAMCVALDEFITAQKWAQAKPSSGNIVSDRGRFLEQFQVMVSRPGSFAGTRGNQRQLYKMARAMRGAGHELSEWMLPPELKGPKLKDPDELQRKPKAEDDAGVEPDAPVDDAPAGDPPA